MPLRGVGATRDIDPLTLAVMRYAADGRRLRQGRAGPAGGAGSALAVGRRRGPGGGACEAAAVGGPVAGREGAGAPALERGDRAHDVVERAGRRRLVDEGPVGQE